MLTSASLRQSVRTAFEVQLGICGLDADSVIALSFSLTGAVDCINRIWLQSSHVPEIKNYDLRTLTTDYSEQAYLSVEHDIFAKARATLAGRDWKGDNFIFLHFGEGVGMAIHDHNGFFYGNRGFAGEIGHIPYPNFDRHAAARRCSCGQENCLETFISASGILMFAHEKFNINAGTLSELFSIASRRQMNQIYEYIYPYLFNVCITAVNLFDPKTLVVGGELVEPWLTRIEKDLLPELQAKSWLNSPDELKCYHMADCNSAVGTALNAIDPVINIIAAR